MKAFERIKIIRSTLAVILVHTTTAFHRTGYIKNIRLEAKCFTTSPTPIHRIRFLRHCYRNAYVYIRSMSIIFFSSDDDHESREKTVAFRRKEMIRNSLLELNIDPELLDQSAIQSIENPIKGFDDRYGKSAIRAYRSFVYKNNDDDDTQEAEENDEEENSYRTSPHTIGAAARTARQIQFLINRHKAHQTEWVRNKDSVQSTDTLKHTFSILQQQGFANEHDVQQQLQTKEKIAKLTTFPIIVLLDNVRSALNVGNIFRTADAAGIYAIYTSGITPHPNGNGSDKVSKSALGAEHTVRHKHFTTTQDAITYIRQNLHVFSNTINCTLGQYELVNFDAKADDCTILVKAASNAEPSWTILGMETTSKSILYTDFDYNRTKGVVLVLGNEVTGIDPDILKSSLLSSDNNNDNNDDDTQWLDHIIEIPMYGIKNSLNVAVCVPIVVYEIIRQWNNNNNNNMNSSCTVI